MTKESSGAKTKADIYGNVTGANVDESKINTVFYVDGASKEASDDNSGSSDVPFKTIAKAVQKALDQKAEGQSCKIIIRAGEYREPIELIGEESDNTAAIIVEGEDGATVKGSVDFSEGWHLKDGVCVNEWPYKFGVADDIYKEYNITMAEIVRRRDMLFINGRNLTPIMEKSTLAEGMFFTDEKNAKVYMIPPKGTDMKNSLIEAAVHKHVLAIEDIKNVVIRNICFTQTSPTQSGSGTGVNRAENVRIENCLIDYSSYFGLGVHGARDITLENLQVNNNGGGGILGTSLDNVLIHNCETSNNNWRGALGGFYDWDTGGIKILFAYDVKVSGHKALDNLAPGVWFDSECRRITIEDCYLKGNTSYGKNITAGVYLEGGIGPFLVERCTMVNNRRGMNLASSNDITIRDCIIKDNTDCQIVLFSNWRRAGEFEGGRTFKARGTDVDVTSHLRDTYMENTVISTSIPDAGPFFNYDHNDEWAYDLWWSTLKTSKMKYYHPNASGAFFKKELAGLCGFKEWKEMTGLDSDAEWVNPKQNS